MTEIAFPLLGATFVVVFVLPILALLAKIGLTLLERDEIAGPLRGLNLRYLLLTGSSVLPLAWFLSAGLHQAESGETALACLFDHAAAALCFEPGLFALTLGLVMVGCSLPALRAFRRAPVSKSSAAAALAARIDGLIAARPSLESLRGRVDVTEQAGLALGAQGLWRPRVILGLAFAARISDDMLASALGHESEHVRSLDPLRFLLLRLALAVNPFGRFLLEPHAARWQAAQETHCDREAVLHGAAPLALAHAIVQAARPGLHEAVALAGRDTAILEFRIAMLLAYAEREPVRRGHRGPSTFPVACVLLLVALLLPHQAGTGALDVLHSGAEQAFTWFWR